MRSLTVLAPGPLSTIQDFGRPGYGHLGIGQSGAADRLSLQRANRIVGNERHVAAIEMTLGRLRIRFETDVVVALAGAPCSVSVAGRPAQMDTAIAVRAGEDVRVGSPLVGLRSYLAVSGGLDVPPVLGSRATDTLSGIGPERLSAGMILPIGPAIDVSPAGNQPVRNKPDNQPGDDHTDGDRARALKPVDLVPDPVLRVLSGPRDDWFSERAWETLCSATWTVTTEANRVGVRLSGPVLKRRLTRELPSEPMVVGALQVPPNGQPIVLLADHPVTGGYPVIGVVAARDLHIAAQLRPGQPVRFRPVR